MLFPNIEVIDAIDQQLAISECLAYIGFDKEREHGVTVRAAIDVAVKGVSTCGQMIYDCCLCLGRSLFGYRFLDCVDLGESIDDLFAEGLLCKHYQKS